MALASVTRLFKCMSHYMELRTGKEISPEHNACCAHFNRDLSRKTVLLGRDLDTSYHIVLGYYSVWETLTIS